MAVFERAEDGFWRGSAQAQGPFAGLQGGGLAAVMVSELETIAKERDLGHAFSVSVEFLRPTALAPLKTSPTIVRRGKRSSVLTNSVTLDGKLTATATVCVIQPTPVLDITQHADQSLNIDSIEALPARPAPHKGPWLMDNFEVRPAFDGTIWFRHKDEIVPGMMPLASVLGPADWTHGLARPQEPLLADPNVNLQIALSRHPVGEHLGIRPKTTWTPQGVGLGEGALFDERGPIGRVAMSAVLIPFA